MRCVRRDTHSHTYPASHALTGQGMRIHGSVNFEQIAAMTPGYSSPPLLLLLPCGSLPSSPHSTQPQFYPIPTLPDPLFTPAHEHCHCLIHSLCSLTCSLVYSRAHSLTCSFSHSLPHWLSHTHFTAMSGQTYMPSLVKLLCWL